MSTTGKTRHRGRVRAARLARPEAERTAAASALARHAAELLDGGLVAAHLSLPAEPGTGPLLASAHARGCDVLVPRVRGDRLEWVRWTPGAPTTPGPFGIDEPVGDPVPDPLTRVRTLFLPALAVDRSGHRLGQGGGYYDRGLATVPPASAGGPLRVACVFDDELVDVLPVEPHDLPVDLALTPSGLVDLRRR